MTRAIISAGSNKDSPHLQVRNAFYTLRDRFKRVQVSKFYLTQAVGPVNQDPFVNAVIGLDTRLSAPELLEYLLHIEAMAGRVRSREIPKGPRILDLDIILFGDEIWSTDRLQIPHPRFRERRFVLKPASEIVSNMRDPVSGKSMSQLLAECTDSSWITLLEEELLAV